MVVGGRTEIVRPPGSTAAPRMGVRDAEEASELHSGGSGQSMAGVGSAFRGRVLGGLKTPAESAFRQVAGKAHPKDGTSPCTTVVAHRTTGSSPLSPSPPERSSEIMQIKTQAEANVPPKTILKKEGS